MNRSNRKEQLMHVFQRIDLNNDQQLSKEELLHYLDVKTAKIRNPL